MIHLSRKPIIYIFVPLTVWLMSMYDFIISHGSYKWTPDVLIRSLVYEIPRCEPTELVEPNMRESFPVLQDSNLLSLIYHYLGWHGSLTSLKNIQIFVWTSHGPSSRFQKKIFRKILFLQNSKSTIRNWKDKENIKMDYSERAITGRVQAAAKLVLQDLDPEAKKRRQEFMSGKF